MKNLRKVLFLFIGILIMNTVNAEGLGKKAKERINTQVEEMSTVMGLNENQKAQMVELKTALFINNKDLAKQYEKGSEEFKAARKKNMKSYQMQVNKVCSKAQMTKWREYKKNKK